MADYFTKLSFAFRCTPDEATHLEAAFSVAPESEELPACLKASFPPAEDAPDDPLSGFAALFDDPESLEVGADIRRAENGVHIFGGRGLKWS